MPRMKWATVNGSNQATRDHRRTEIETTEDHRQHRFEDHRQTQTNTDSRTTDKHSQTQIRRPQTNTVKHRFEDHRRTQTNTDSRTTEEHRQTQIRGPQKNTDKHRFQNHRRTQENTDSKTAEDPRRAPIEEAAENTGNTKMALKADAQRGQTVGSIAHDEAFMSWLASEVQQHSDSTASSL